MNPLEALKDKLRVKQIVKPNEGVKITLVVPKVPVPIKITAEKDTGEKANEILDKIHKNKLSNVIKKFPEPQKMDEPKAPIIQEQPKMKPKKIQKEKIMLVEEGEKGDEEFEKLPEGGPKLIEIQPEEAELQKVELQKEEPEEINQEIIKPRKRITTKVTKGVIPLGPELMVQIGDTPLAKRLPPLPTFNVKVSSYYMNNREIFINFINGLFETYKDDLLDESKGISCEDIGKDTGEVSLLTHQKIVRDYMNLYTPYRGLLLYHGLGSGKTCSSIAIAEGMKSSRKVIIMTPASLKRNYMEEIKKCGDLIYRKNQYWEWISIDDNPELLDPLSASLGLPREYIRRNHGAWLVNITKQNNYAELSTSDKKTLNDQLDEMIRNKYTFINYNGLRREKFKQLTNNYENNIFDNAVVIIDEAHNLISRIVNKINKTSKFAEKKRGPDGILPTILALQIYEFLLRSENSRIVLLTGTPIINYPNEIGILFNILRGYIKTWNFTLNTETNKKLSKEELLNIFAKEKILDYVDYIPSSRTLTITRNPYGFENKITSSSGYKGVTNEKKEKRNEKGDIVKNSKGDIIYEERGTMTDDEFVKRIVKLLKKNDITAVENGTTFSVNTALPDTLDEFMNIFINKTSGTITNIDKFKRRIIGLTSYFRSAQEELLPAYDKNFDRHIVNVPMSNYQFKKYEEYRLDERKSEKTKKKTSQIDSNGLFIEPTSTYRIFSRLACNFVMPTPPGRPMPSEYRKNMELKEKEKAQQKQVDNKEVRNITEIQKQKDTKALEKEQKAAEKAAKVLEKEKKAAEKEAEKAAKALEKEQKAAEKAAEKEAKEAAKALEKEQKAAEKAAKEAAKLKAKEEKARAKGITIDELSDYEDEDEDEDEDEEKQNGGLNDDNDSDNIYQKFVDEGDDEENVILSEYKDEDAKEREKDELEGDEILETMGDNMYKKMIDESMNYLKAHKSTLLSPEGLKTYSPKFLSMIENIEDPEHQGLHLVYSQFRSMEGIGIFALSLEANGFSQFKIKRTSSGWEINMSEEDMGKPCYALYTGTEDAEEREIIRNIYNGSWDNIPNNIADQLKAKSNNNNMGEIIKVLMITSAGSEGINLRNTRYVHIMEPYWHPVRVEQVIGRARRICSHQALPKKLQTVEVFIYIMVFTEEQLNSEYAIELKLNDTSKIAPYLPQSSDQKLFEISTIKEQLTSQLLTGIKESSIDCATHIKSATKEGLTCLSFGQPNVNEFSYNPNYSQDANDTIAAINRTTIDWEARPFTLKTTGKKYILRMDTKHVYDYNSVMQAKQIPGVRPVLLGKLVKNSKGEYEIVKETI
jgi:Helicase conserved C-terminal domain/Type III restriction enzyme, res subunit